VIKKLLYRLKYRYAKHLRLSAPVDVSLELSSACNLSCTYCYHNDKNNLPFNQKIMTQEMAFKAIEEACDLEVESIKFNYRGEATLNPYFASIVKRARYLSYGKTFQDRILNSNFMFKDSDNIFEALCSLTKVKVSLDSFNKEVLEGQRIGADLDRIISNVDRFYYSNQRKNTELVIQSVITSKNKDEDIISQVKRRWPDATHSVRDMVTGRIQKDLSNLENKQRDLSKRQSCIQAHARMIIHHDGMVSPCCPSIKGDLIIGDFNTRSLYSIFNSLEAKMLRQSLKNKTAFSKEPCKSCPSFESYKPYKHPWNS